MNILDNLYPEHELISLLLQYPDKWGSQIFSAIRPEMIQSDNNRAIYEHCLELRAQSKEINILAFHEHQLLLPHIVDLMPIISGINGISYTPLIGKIVADYKRRTVINMAQEIGNKAMYEKAEIEEIFRHIEETRTSLNVTTSNNFKSLADIIDEVGNPEAYKDMTVSCLKTGWKVFDSRVIIKPGDLIVLAGRPSSGKTDWALQFAKTIGKHGHASAIFSLETAGQYLNRRLAGGNNLQEYLDGCADNVDLPIFIDDNPIQNLFSARAQVEYAKKIFGIEIAIFDYLTLMEAPKQENRNREVEELIKGLKIIARETNIPFMVIAQLSRAVEARRDKRPMLADLRDSGAIEQVIDICLMTYRPSNYGMNQIEEVDDTTNYLELVNTKQRDGAKGILQFFYDAATKKIGDWSGNQIGYEDYHFQEDEDKAELINKTEPF